MANGAGGPVQWWARLIVSVLGASIGVGGAVVGLVDVGTLSTAPERGLSDPLSYQILVLCAVWLLTVFVVTYVTEHHIMPVVVSSIGFPGMVFSLVNLGGIGSL